MQSTSWETLGWKKHKLESRLSGEISVTSDMQMTPPRGIKEPLDGSESGEWKSWLKAQLQKTMIMASGPIASWEVDGETVETVSDFILGGSKITANDDWSHEIKRRLLLGRKVMTNLDSIFKSRDIAKKVCLVKAMVSPVLMYGCECWTVNKAECRRIDAFELWCWRRLLSVPWDQTSPFHDQTRPSFPGYSAFLLTPLIGPGPSRLVFISIDTTV